MKMLITGANGQLGSEVVRQATAMDYDLLAVDLPEYDITIPETVNRLIADYRPYLVLNAAAYTQVDLAESQEKPAWAVNADAALNLALACSAKDIPLIHISTDFVFDGKKTTPYRESDPVAPLSVYGKSKAAGDDHIRGNLDHHVIVRTSWLYGVQGNNFVKTMIRLASERETLNVVADQFGCPTAAADLADALLTISRSIFSSPDSRWGTYHYCGQGVVSWHQFAQAIIDISKKYRALKVTRVNPIPTSDYPTPAMRPAYSAMNCEKITKEFGVHPVPWKKSLEKTIQEIMAVP
ncbi:MAG: dTDP-4-dehydrorhamnose reductase [Desulfatirhabdiaceae bacterium]